MKNPEISLDGSKRWYNAQGQIHRDGGPAIEGPSGSGYKEWYINGLTHREDGPAIEWADGTKFWCIEGHIVK